MAGNDLANAYSILGQGTTAEYNRRRKEEEDYRRSARKDARKDQLISYFAAPILQGAGQALASGATELIGGMVLGDNTKSFFNTEAGMIAARKAAYADKVETDLTKQRGQLATKGKSQLEGNVDLYTANFRALLEGEYGSDPKNQTLINAIIEDNRSSIRKAAVAGLNSLDSTIKYASQSPDIDVLKARVKSGDGFWSKSTGSRIMSTLGAKLLGKKDLASEGARYILTGSKDGDAADRQIFRDLAGEDFEEKLAERLRGVQDFKRGTLTNIIIAFKKDNPKIFEALSTGQQDAIDARTVSIQYGSEVDSLLSQSKDPNYITFVNKNRDTFTNVTDLTDGYAVQIGGITDKDAKRFTARYVGAETNKETVAQLERAVARSHFNLDSGEIESLYDGSSSNEKRVIEVKKATVSFIRDSLAPAFNEDLGALLSELTPEQVSELSLSPGNKRQLAKEWMSFTIKNNLGRELIVAYKNKSWDNWIGDEITTEGEQRGTIRDPNVGLEFLRKRLSSEQEIDSLSSRSENEGSDKEVRQAKQQLIKPYNASISSPRAKKMFSFVYDSTMSREDRERKLRTGIDGLRRFHEEKAIEQGHTVEDGVANLSPSLVTSLTELEKELLSQIYPSSSNSWMSLGQGGK